MSTSGSKSNEHVAHFLVDIHIFVDNLKIFIEKVFILIIINSW